jgi:hypothetical protein
MPYDECYKKRQHDLARREDLFLDTPFENSIYLVAACLEDLSCCDIIEDAQDNEQNDNGRIYK